MCGEGNIYGKEIGTQGEKNEGNQRRYIKNKKISKQI